MKAWRILWDKIFSPSKPLLLLIVLSSSVYALMVVPLWLQKIYLENVEKYISGELLFSTLFISLVGFYLVRSLTGGFLIPLGHVRDLYYDYIIARNVSLSQHQLNNKIPLNLYESSKVYNLLMRTRRALISGGLRESIKTLGALLTLVLSLGSLLGTLYFLNPIFSLLAFVSVIPIFLEHMIFAKKFSQLNKEITEDKRRQEQSVKHILGKEYFLETRVAGGI